MFTPLEKTMFTLVYTLAVVVLVPPLGSASLPGGIFSPISFCGVASDALAPAGSVIKLAGAKKAPPSLLSNRSSGSKNDPTIAMVAVVDTTRGVPCGPRSCVATNCSCGRGSGVVLGRLSEAAPPFVACSDPAPPGCALGTALFAAFQFVGYKSRRNQQGFYYAFGIGDVEIFVDAE